MLLPWRLAPRAELIEPSDADQEKLSLACRLAILQKDASLSIIDKKVVVQLSSEFETFSFYSVAVSNIEKDLGNYFINIDESPKESTACMPCNIADPQKPGKKPLLGKFLGRQVVFALDAVNNVGTAATSVTTTAQRKAVVTITVLYADPRFELSTGTAISTLANRSFANQTNVTQSGGASPTQGNVVITQTIARPTDVLFAGANWRIPRNFVWPDHRRGAFHLTATVGVNVVNAATEFGVGPSISWLSRMFSALYDWGHDVKLTQGEFVGEVWCNETAATTTVPKCSGAPPTPSTEKYWRGVFAFGISVRVPSVFGGSSSSGH